MVLTGTESYWMDEKPKSIDLDKLYEDERYFGETYEEWLERTAFCKCDEKTGGNNE